jgi:hypothetical protein
MCEECDPQNTGLYTIYMQEWNSNAFHKYPKHLDKIKCFACRNNAIYRYQNCISFKPIDIESTLIPASKLTDRKDIQRKRLLRKVKNRKPSLK